MFLITWINSQLSDIRNDINFKYYFNSAVVHKEEDELHIINAAKGIELVLKDGLIISSIHLFGDGHSDYMRFAEELPFNINFSMSRLDIKNLFGPPKKFRDKGRSLHGDIQAWDKYYFTNYSLHFQYSNQADIIDLVTIASLSLESYFNIELQ